MNESALRVFSLPTQQWFRESFGAPTTAQAEAWEAISAGQDALVVAPTGSGKTLAAFLWAIDQLHNAEPNGCRVLYVSPLKALAVDVERNLQLPLAGIEAKADELGVQSPRLQVGVRTGDTTPQERRRFRSTQPDILITTPESLFLLLTSAAREGLRNIDTVIIDEIHAVASTKRGAHLALSLERLDELLPKPAQRIGLSATVRPVEEVARFLGGSQPVTVVAPKAKKQWKLEVIVPVPDMADPPNPVANNSHEGKPHAGNPGADSPTQEPNKAKQIGIWPHIDERIVQLIAEHKSTLIFANARRLAERLTARINEIWDAPDAEPLARAHHGSVSHEQRKQIEEDLKAGRLRAVVATSSLELGIDMGAIDLVIQVEAPSSVAAGLQRIGRAGHQVGAVSHGVLLPKFQGDLLQTAVVASRMQTGAIEELRIPANPLDVLAQQIVAMVAMDDWSLADMEVVLRRCANYATLTRPVLESVLDMLSGRYPSDEFVELRPRLNWDRNTDLLTGRRGAQHLAVISGGTIPDRGLYGVFLADGSGPGRRVGELDEEMVYESRVGDVFALGTSNWRIEKITHDRVLVLPAPGVPARMPFWHGDGLGRPAELGEAVGAFTRFLDGLPKAKAKTELAKIGLDEWAVENLLNYLHQEKSQSGYLPTDQQLVVQRSRDEVGDWRVVVLSPYGGQVHAPWALLAAARLRERFGADVQAMHGDDGMLFRIPDTGLDWEGARESTIDDQDLLAAIFPDPEQIREAISDQLGSSALFAARFRESANRALLLPKRRPQARRALWQQRLQAAQLLEVANTFPSFPIIMEAVRECLNDVFDVPALEQVLTKVRSGAISTVSVVLPKPSGFTSSLLMGYMATFMYEYDTPLAERRAAALSLDPQLLAQLLGTTNAPALAELLDADQLARTEAGLQHLVDGRKARDADEIVDLLRALGPLDTTQLRRRSREPDQVDEWLMRLSEHGRISNPTPAWLAAEDIEEPPSLERWVQRYARTHVPFTFQELAAWLNRTGIQEQSLADTAKTITDLITQGKLIEGELRPPDWLSPEATAFPEIPAVANAHQGHSIQYCDPNVLQILRRRSIAALRKAIEPVPAVELARFLPSWHEFGKRKGSEGVFRTLEQLAGIPIPASAWENLVLPARVTDYQSGMLDELLASGEVVWQGNGTVGNGDGWISFHLAETARLTLKPTAAVEELSHQTSTVLDLLSNGAYFSRDLADSLELSQSETESELWELAWGGLISNDSFAGVRALLKQGQGAHRTPPTRLHTRVGRPRLRLNRPNALSVPNVGGRWWAIPSLDLDPTKRAVAAAEYLLDRYPILTRGSVVAEEIQGGFAAVYRVLAAAEDAGQLRRGYFIEGLGAAQFTQTEVVDRLRSGILAPGEILNQAMALAACDPANPYGAALPWPSRTSGLPGRKPGALVVQVDGVLTLYVERGGRTALTWSCVPEVLAAAAQSLAELVRKQGASDITIEKVDGEFILSTANPLPDALVAAGFKMTARGYTLRANKVC